MVRFCWERLIRFSALSFDTIRFTFLIVFNKRATFSGIWQMYAPCFASKVGEYLVSLRGVFTLSA